MYRKMTAAVLAAAALALAPHAAGASNSGNEVRVEDRCDPATFDAAVGPGTCVPTPDGDTTFDEFAAALPDGGDDHWRFQASGSSIRRNETVTVKNTGGEFHTFTEVQEYGPGCIELLNVGLGFAPGVFAPECQPEVAPGVPLAFVTTGVPAGGSLQVSGLSKGTHYFMCLIHPWMQAEVNVR